MPRKKRSDNITMKVLESSTTVAAIESSALSGPPHNHASYSIVGIGSSAGGLEALEEFFSHMPPDPKIAFVVVSHQNPNHASLLPELLRRWTALPVIEATDGLRLEPNMVYLPPPGSRLAILHAVLHLMESSQGERPFLPIDYFFRSLADDQQDHAIGIVLSGTGTDGSLGLKAIKGASGMTMAQDPRSAKYAGMPQSAIDAGVADFVLPTADLVGLPAQPCAGASCSGAGHHAGSRRNNCRGSSQLPAARVSGLPFRFRFRCLRIRGIRERQQGHTFRVGFF